jgi:hypothetical protein
MPPLRSPDCPSRAAGGEQQRAWPWPLANRCERRRPGRGRQPGPGTPWTQLDDAWRKPRRFRQPERLRLQACVGFADYPGLHRGSRKDFFFEKKKQKTFATWAQPIRGRRRQVAKVFWFFFSKKNIFLTFRPNPTIIVRRGNDATFPNLGRFSFSILRAGLRSCRPLFRAHQPDSRGFIYV